MSFIESIASVLTEGLNNICDQDFLQVFKTKFDAQYFKPSQTIIKDMKNSQNPLYRLIEVNKQQKGKNTLVLDLIHMAVENIEIDNTEILQDVFNQPNQSSFTYAIIFEDCFKISKLRQKIFTQLLIQLNAWEEQGLRANEIHQWKHYNNEQCKIACAVWNYICQLAKKSYKIDTLVHRQETEMNDKLDLVDNVVSCLYAYCQDTCDKTFYDNQLKNVQEQLKEKVLGLVEIPPELYALLPFAKSLNPLTNSEAWQTFLKKHSKGMLTLP